MRIISTSAIAILLCVILFGPHRAHAGWLNNGVPVCAAANDQWRPRIAASDSSKAIIAWYDRRAGGAQADIYAQKIDRYGEIEWTADGVAVCTAANNQEKAAITSDGMGGAVIVWEDNRSGVGPHVYAQRVDSNGLVMWTADGVRLCTAGSNQYLPEVVTDGSGGAISVWQDVRGFGNELYAQRIVAAGTVKWIATAVPVCTATGTQVDHVIIPDGSGGAIIAWRDRRSGTYDIYAQFIDSLGVVQWVADGAPVCIEAGDQVYPQLILDGAGGAIVTWEDTRGANSDIYIQRIDGSGSLLWNAAGIALCSASGNQYAPMIAKDFSGGAYLAWRDFRGSNSDIYAQRIDAAGDTLWKANGIVICQAPGNQYTPLIMPDESNGAILLWQDDRYGNYDLFAQRVEGNGAIVWVQNGIPICTATGTQDQHSIASDGHDGAIVAWKDARPNASSPDIYVNSVNFAGKQKVPVLAAKYTVNALPDRIELEWLLAYDGGDISCAVYRAEGPGAVLLPLPTDWIERDGLRYFISDRSCTPNTTYRYRVVTLDETGGTSLFETGPVTTPGLSVALYQNYPNPFNPSTMISFSLPEAAQAMVSIYDPRGTLIRVLADGMFDAGVKELRWDGTDSRGARVSSGIYFYRLTAGKRVLTKKMVLVK